MSSPNASEADRLKAEGNALFAKKNFKGAYKKYTEALKHDDKNPILYSNRAACSLGLNRYLDASTDAAKATSIDPGYAKGWGRLAAARMGLNSVNQAVDAWTRALSVLPVDNLTPAEKKQRDQYDSELSAARAKLEDIEANPKNPEGIAILRSWEHEKLPWKRAMAILPGLVDSFTWNSSAWVIERAYTNWRSAVNAMKEGYILQRTPAGPTFVGRFGVLEDFSNALIEDSRVFHIADQDFVSMYNQQVQFEVTMTRAWSDNCARGVIQEVPKRLKAEGWNSVRPALAVTVRGWILRAFVEDRLRDSTETALDFYTSAIEVLNWGAERWKDVPSEDKGAIFQPTFLRGVKCLRLDALMKTYKRVPGKFTLEGLLADADDILSELPSVAPEPHGDDIPFFLSFFRYPFGQAHAVRGFCLLNMAKLARQANGGDLTIEISKQYLDASVEYFTAAMAYPMDDENRSWFLHCAYHTQFDGGTTPKLLLRNLDMLEESVPMMKKIWEFSPDADKFLKSFEADLKMRENLQQMESDSVIFNSQPGTVV